MQINVPLFPMQYNQLLIGNRIHASSMYSSVTNLFLVALLILYVRTGALKQPLVPLHNHPMFRYPCIRTLGFDGGDGGRRCPSGRGFFSKQNGFAFTHLIPVSYGGVEMLGASLLRALSASVMHALGLKSATPTSRRSTKRTARPARLSAISSLGGGLRRVTFLLHSQRV